MEVELRHLRALVAVVEAGTFTDAAIELGISQTAVSRHVAALESVLGVRLLHRTTRSVELTPAGEQAIRHARRALAVVSEMRRESSARSTTVRIGYAWSALGKLTPEFQRRSVTSLPHLDLRLIRSNTPTAGLLEGVSDVAILRRTPDTDTPDAARTDVIGLELIGHERRYCAMSTEDPLARRRDVTLAQIAALPLAVDARTGSTRLDLWPEGQEPQQTIPTDDVDDWLTVISSGAARGVTAESTAHQYRREGLVYRPVRDAAPVRVQAAWLLDNAPPALEQIIALLRDLYL